MEIEEGRRAEDGHGDADIAFVRLREVLGAPDRHGLRGRLGGLGAPRGRRAEGALGGGDTSTPRWLRLVAVPIVGAGVILLLGALRPSPGPTEAGPPTTPTDVVARPSASAPLPPPTPPTPHRPERLWPDGPVSVEGNVVRRGDERWVVGAPGDVVVVGDWDCDLEPTPAVLRPASGGFYVFDGWADGPAAPARKVIERPGAIVAEASGCGVAVLRAADGVGHEVPTQEAGV